MYGDHTKYNPPRRLSVAKKMYVSNLRKKIILAAVIVFSVLCLSEYVLAQPPDTTERITPTTKKQYTLPTITVTADKREIDVQKLPMSVQVITDQQLEDSSMKTIGDVLQHIPNLMVNSSFVGLSYMSFRGSGTSEASETAPLAIYLDGVPIDPSTALDLNLLDIERVEILRGVQSVLYGKNVLGGIVNVISKKPGNTNQGKFSLRGESYGTAAASGIFRGSIVEDKLFFSLAGELYKTDGFMKSEVSAGRNKRDSGRFKGQIYATPTDDSEFSVYLNYSKVNSGFPPYKWGEHPGTASNAAMSSDDQNLEQMSAALHGKIDFSSLTVESVSTFRHMTLDALHDYSHVPAFQGFAWLNAGRKQNEATQEIRLKSPDSSENNPFKWLAGAYAGYLDRDQDLTYGGGILDQSQTHREYSTDFALFGQIDIPLTESLTLTPGVRWHYTNKSAAIKNSMASMFMNTSLNKHERGNWHELLPKLTLSYAITDNHMVYAGVSRSFLPGGFNYLASGVATSDLKYDSQKAWNYEAGAKTSWLDKRITASVTFFYIDTEKMQVSILDPLTYDFTVKNAGATTSYGMELDLAARIAEGLSTDASLGCTHATFDSYNDGRADYSGNDVPISPRFTAQVGLTYRHEDGFFARAEMQHFGKSYWDASNEGSRSAFQLVNARLGYEAENFEAYIYGKNIFGERYYSHYLPSSNTGIMGDPQRFGIEFVYKF